MKRMRSLKRMFCMLLLLLLLSSCAGQGQQVQLAVLKGSTGLGAVQLMQNERYSVSLSSDASELMAKLINGQLDIAALPTNAAAMAYAKTGGQVQMLAINTLGVLYLLEQGQDIDELADLEGKTIVAFGQGANPEYVLEYLLERSGVSVTMDWKATVDEVLAAVAAGQAEVVMLPEPNVTVALSKNPAYRVCLDLNQAWEEASEGSLVMGCIVARRDFIERQPEAVERFLADYRASIDFALSEPEAPALIAQQGIVPSQAVAEKAIPACHLVCITGAQMQPAIEAYYEVLFAADPKSVGGAVPDADFYYAAP